MMDGAGIEATVTSVTVVKVVDTLALTLLMILQRYVPASDAVTLYESVNGWATAARKNVYDRGAGAFTFSVVRLSVHVSFSNFCHRKVTEL